LRLCTLV